MFRRICHSRLLFPNAKKEFHRVLMSVFIHGIEEWNCQRGKEKQCTNKLKTKNKLNKSRIKITKGKKGNENEQWWYQMEILYVPLKALLNILAWASKCLGTRPVIFCVFRTKENLGREITRRVGRLYFWYLTWNIVHYAFTF